MLRFDKMTVKAQEACRKRKEMAARHENQQIEPVHLLAALVAQTDGVVPPLLARLGVRSEALTQDIEREIGRLPKVQGFAQQHMGRPLNDVLERRVQGSGQISRTSTFPRSIFFWQSPAQDRDPAGQLLKRQGARTKQFCRP